MKTDRELLELAAKAAGYQPWGSDCEGWPIFVADGQPMGWNPLTDDGDALRLAAKLSITIEFGLISVASYLGCAVTENMIHAHSYERDDRNQVIRRAITRAAAAIGESMP